MKVVIANSIGIDKNKRYIIHSPSRWTESVTCRESWFAYYPWELSYLSSLLKRETTHDVKFLDGCLKLLDRKSYTQKILDEAPDVLVLETASRMAQENIAMALDIKKQQGTKLIFVGQHASAFPEDLIKLGVDYVVNGEYEYTVLDILKDTPRELIKGLHPNSVRDLLDINSLPWPEDHDVSRIDYAIPGEPSSEYCEVQMYASRGCPHSCSFCVARNVYYKRPNWRSRKVEDVVNEIIYLKNKYPKMQGIFFDEEEHNVGKPFIIALSKMLQEKALTHLKIEAMCNIRNFDSEMLKFMKLAGYYKVRVGLETASQVAGESVNKPISHSMMYKTLELIQSYNINVHGTMMIGLPGSLMEEDQKTITMMNDLIHNKLIDSLQISSCTPLPGTLLYGELKEKGYLTESSYEAYDGGGSIVVNYPQYSKEQIGMMYEKAFLARDHAFLLRKIASPIAMLSWIIKIINKYGFIKTMSKLLKRVKRELLWMKKKYSFQ